MPEIPFLRTLILKLFWRRMPPDLWRSSSQIDQTSKKSGQLLPRQVLMSRVESSHQLFLPYPISLVYFTLSLSHLDFQYIESTFTKMCRDDSSRVELLTFPTLHPYHWCISANSLAIRLPVSRSHNDSSWVVSSCQLFIPYLVSLM